MTKRYSCPDCNRVSTVAELSTYPTGRQESCQCGTKVRDEAAEYTQNMLQPLLGGDGVETINLTPNEYSKPPSNEPKENLGRGPNGGMLMTVSVRMNDGSTSNHVIEKPGGYHPLTTQVGIAAMEQIGLDPKDVAEISTKRGGGGTIWTPEEAA